MLMKLYDYNHQDSIWSIRDYTAGSYSQRQDNLHQWGGGRTRRLLQSAYTIAFLCLLRFDEVLKIQAQDITLHSLTHIELTLPFRKTDQFGGKFSPLVFSVVENFLLNCIRYQAI
jgi:hypothetical protein